MAGWRSHLWQALGYAWRGFRHAWRTQGNMRIHTGIGVFVVALGRWLEFEAVQQALLVLTVGTVIGAEWINTAIERTVDRITRRPDPLARLAKDVAAGAVLWFSFVSVVIGYLLFYPHLDTLLHLLATASPARRLEMVTVIAAAVALVFSGLRR